MKYRMKAMSKPDTYGRKGPDDIPGRHGGHMDNGYSGWIEPVQIWEPVRDVFLAIQSVRTASHERPGFIVHPGRAETLAGFLDALRDLSEHASGQASARSWCDAVRVMVEAQSVTNATGNDLGGSKVGDQVVPGGSRWSEARNQALTRALEGVWERTFGTKTRVGSRDLEFFPHSGGSRWFPVVPGTTSGNRTGSGSGGSQLYRGNHRNHPLRGAWDSGSDKQDHGNHLGALWGNDA